LTPVPRSRGNLQNYRFRDLHAAVEVDAEAAGCYVVWRFTNNVDSRYTELF